MPEVRIVPAGDAALLVELPARIDPDTSARVIAIADALRARCGTALRDVVIGYCTATVYFDPLTTDVAWLESEVRAVVGDLPELRSHVGSAIDVPVCYGGELGPDLAEVAAFAGSAAIAAGQTGIYPAETPGGWHIIGRTWVKPYDASRAEPFLFRPGDRVRFHAVTREEFDRAACPA